jgi:hypothetical protein
MAEEKYVITITRTDSTEFKAEFDSRPGDKFGKRMVAIVLLNIAENLDPALIGEKVTGQSNDQLDL